ncbi:unnamed protein product [Calicophoron daubneyi]|uniref:palmitoyl-protein hydrolase n=1 Tax=Calicophoron daubneyi TaxID=300641 RepID=A0AAV2TJN3_CALDB
MGNNLGCTLPGIMSSSKLLPAVVCASRSAQTATLIFLHGLGDTGHGWSGMLREIIPDYCKLICPHAPSIPVTLNAGIRMPAWYDIYSLGIDAQQDEEGLIAASAELDKFVDAEIKSGISAKRIIIGGFSQGGSVALYNALTKDHEYGGIILLSSWLPVHTKFVGDHSLVGMPKNTPLLQCHGTEDCVIPFEMGKATHELLKDFSLTNCDFNSYPHMGHSSGDQEMQDVQTFLTKNLPML